MGVGRQELSCIEREVMAGPASFLLDFREIGTLVPMGFRIVVVGNRVEPGSVEEAFCEKVIGRADDRRRIHSAAQFREHWDIGSHSPTHGLREDYAEMLFVFSVRSVADCFRGVEVPVFSDGDLSWRDCKE